MKSLKVSLRTAVITGVCMAAFSAGAYLCIPTPICSVYENLFPDFYLMEESIITGSEQQSLAEKEEKYTNAIGRQQGGYLRPVRGVKSKHSEIITKMQEAAGNGANIIQKSSSTSLDDIGISDLGNYSSAKSQIEEKLTVRPKSERNGKNYTTADLNTILQQERTAVNDFAANAIGMGAAETVNAAVVAAESDPETRAKQIAKAETLAELFELMLGMDRRIYERSLHASAVEATNAGVEALQALAGTSATSSGQ